MLTVGHDALPALRPLFAPERPGPLVFEHVVHSGLGRVRADRWPDPQVVCAEPPGNVALRGDPSAPDVAEFLDEVTGFVDAPPDWLPALRTSDPGVAEWNRVPATVPRRRAGAGPGSSGSARPG